MIEALESQKVCRACGTANEPSAQRCVTCGADLHSPDEPANFVDDDPALTHVEAERIDFELAVLSRSQPSSPAACSVPTTFLVN